MLIAEPLLLAQAVPLARTLELSTTNQSELTLPSNHADKLLTSEVALEPTSVETPELQRQDLTRILMGFRHLECPTKELQELSVPSTTNRMDQHQRLACQRHPAWRPRRRFTPRTMTIKSLPETIRKALMPATSKPMKSRQLPPDLPSPTRIPLVSGLAQTTTTHATTPLLKMNHFSRASSPPPKATTPITIPESDEPSSATSPDINPILVGQAERHRSLKSGRDLPITTLSRSSRRRAQYAHPMTLKGVP